MPADAPARRFALRPDPRGAVWDALLYVPTVALLAYGAAIFWYGESRTLAYVLSFLASLFLLIGANRVLKTRLMLLPSAPTAIEVQDESLSIFLRDGSRADLVKQPRVYADLAGRSLGVSGLDRQGKRLQFVFHRGQFAEGAVFEAARDCLQRLQKRSGGKG